MRVQVVSTRARTNGMPISACFMQRGRGGYSRGIRNRSLFRNAIRTTNPVPTAGPRIHPVPTHGRNTLDKDAAYNTSVIGTQCICEGAICMVWGTCPLPPRCLQQALNTHGVHIPLTVIVIARVNITMCVICMDSAVIVTSPNY